MIRLWSSEKIPFDDIHYHDFVYVKSQMVQTEMMLYKF